MKATQVCVLGAGGAIGSRLVQALMSNGVPVTAVVRRLESAIRIGRWPVKIEVADLNAIDQDKLLSILNGHSTVIDCSYSMASDVEENKVQSKQIASNLIAACNRLAIPNLIHFGTISVYPTNEKSVDEQIECKPQGLAYADGKLIAEQTLLANSNKTNVLVLQLPIVIGPFMGWTRSIIQQLAKNTLVMPDTFLGKCNALHVDDVVHATRLGMEYLEGKDIGLVSERILICGEERSWHEFYQAHSKHMPNSDIQLTSRADYSSRIKASQVAREPWVRIKRKFSEDGDFRQLVLAQWGFRSLYGLVKNRRGQAGIDQIKSRLSERTEKVDESTELALLSQALFSTLDTMPLISGEKAKTLLNYSAQYKFDESIESSMEWAHWAGLLS